MKVKSKPAWLKIDFEKWQLQVSDDDENTTGESGETDRMAYDKAFQGFDNEVLRANGDMMQRGTIGWFTSVALFQILCYSLILYRLYTTVTSTRSPDDIWFPLGEEYLYAAQIFSLCDVIHPIIGLTDFQGFPGSVVRVGMSNFIVFAVFAPAPDVQSSPYMFWLVLLWALHEIVRHTHDCFLYHQLSDKFIKWLRENNWLILYPQFFFIGGKTLQLAIYSADDHERMLLDVVPNVWGISSSFGLFLRVCLMLYIPLCVAVLKNMWNEQTKSYEKDKETKEE